MTSAPSIPPPPLCAGGGELALDLRAGVGAVGVEAAEKKRPVREGEFKLAQPQPVRHLGGGSKKGGGRTGGCGGCSGGGGVAANGCGVVGGGEVREGRS